VEDLLRLKDAAAKLGISVSSLRRICSQGLIPVYRLTPRTVAVRPEDLLAYLQRVKEQPQPISAFTGRWGRQRQLDSASYIERLRKLGEAGRVKPAAKGGKNPPRKRSEPK
jgi:predicted DNA-binding transcriptional regulator AlpA